MMECWNTGVLGHILLTSIPSFQNSISAFFRYSSIPLLRILLRFWAERFRLKRAVAFFQKSGQAAFFLGVFEPFV
jgi:hypothetical protein